MNRRNVFPFIFLVLLGLLLWLFWRPTPKTPLEKVDEEPSSSILSESPSRTNVLTPNKGTETPTNKLAAQNEGRLQQMSNAVERSLNEWRTPIEFYGKVVDQSDLPVSDAQVFFSCNDLSESGTSDYKATSDAQGMFSITGISGKLLTVNVQKDGYYPSKRDDDSYYYAGQNVNFRPDINLPVVFHLRKKGPGVDLLTSESGMNRKLGVSVPKDGSPVLVDLIQKAAGASGQLEISQTKPPWQGATNWSFRLRMLDGGLVENQDEYQFQAPASGYQSTVEYDFSKADTNWTTQVSKQFYIVFGNPRKFGWLNVECNLRQQTVFLTYAINLEGSQNLEPQQ